MKKRYTLIFICCLVQPTALVLCADTSNVTTYKTLKELYKSPVTATVRAKVNADFNAWRTALATHSTPSSSALNLPPKLPASKKLSASAAPFIPDAAAATITPAPSIYRTSTQRARARKHKRRQFRNAQLNEVKAKLLTAFSKSKISE